MFVTVVLVLGGGGLVAFRVVGELQAELRNLQTTVPRAVDRLERSDRVGRVVREFRLGEKVDRLLAELPDRSAVLLGGCPGDDVRIDGPVR